MFKGLLRQGAKKLDDFTSSIDWRKWVKDTNDFDNNPDVIKHLNEIEKTTKGNGTWMKNADGSAFKGTQEEFVIQQSDNFKKAFPNPIRDAQGNIQTNYHGSPNTFEAFDESRASGVILGKGIYTTPDTEVSNIFKKNNPKGVTYEMYINSDNPQNIVTNNHFVKHTEKLNDLKNRWRAAYGDSGSKQSDDIYKEIELLEADWGKKYKDELKMNELQDGFDYYERDNMSIIPFSNNPKSMKGNILLDMANPNIFKAIVPGAIGLGAASQMTGPVQADGQFKEGGSLFQAQDGLGVGVPDPSKQINFMKDWANSSMHNQMLDASSSSEKFKNKVKIARRNFDNVNIVDEEVDGFLGQYINGQVTMNPSAMEEYVIGNGYDSVLVHELSHFTDDGDPDNEGYFDASNIPLSDRRLIKKYGKEGKKRLKKEEKELNELLISEGLRPNDKEVIEDRLKRVKYLNRDTETRSRINATRYFYELDDEFGRESDSNIDKNLPSIFNSPVTPEMIEVMKKSGQYQQLQEIYTDDQILEMFNTISDTNNVDTAINTVNAKYGIEVLPNAQKGAWIKTGLKALAKQFPSLAKFIDDAAVPAVKNATNKTDEVVEEMVEVVTGDGSIRKVPKSLAVRVNRVEDANVTNNSFKNYEDGNWFADKITPLYTKHTKNVMDPTNASLYPDDPRRLFTAYFDPEDIKKFGLKDGLGTQRARSLSGGPGTQVHPNEYVVPPALVEFMRKTGTGPGFKTQILNQQNTFDNIFDFYKKHGGQVAIEDYINQTDLPQAQRGWFKSLIKQGAKKLDDVLGAVKKVDNFEFKSLPTIEKKQFMKVVDGEFDSIDYDHLVPTTQEITDLAAKTRSRLMSDKFIKNNMEATGRSKDEVVSYIDDYIKEFENSTLAFDKTPDRTAGLYTTGKITIDPRNPHLTKENVLGTLEHEIEHMFSNVRQQGSDLYRHPKFKLVDRTGMPDEDLVQNMGQAFEQQVRFRKALGWLEKNAGLKVGDNVTDEQVEALTDAIANWSKEQGKDFRGSGANFDIQHLFSSLDAQQFLKPGQYLMPNAPRTANLKNSNVRQGIKDILNKTYAAAAVGGLGAASQMGPKQEDGQYKYGGSPSKAQVGLETGDYVVEDGDTFYGIANKNNISWKDLISSNPSVDINRLSLGDTLQVPGYTAPVPPEKIAVKQNTYNPYAPTNELATQRRADLDSALNTVVGASDNNMNLRTLLYMTGAMENNWGNNPDAYIDKDTGKPRGYTRGMMSIDDSAYKDLFEPRGTNGRFVDNQKKMFEWLKGIGYDYTQMNDILRSNDPLAGMAAARMQYARRPEPLPDGNDPDAVYEYYMKHYNRTGADHKERFMGNWNEFIKKKEKKTGGETIYNEYKKYVDHGFTGSKKSQENYDKLNRVHYKDAKSMGMSPANYIMTNILGSS